VPSVLEKLPQGSRIAIIRLRSLGDCVLTTPALQILKRERPDVRVGVAVEDRFRELFEDHPDVDEILPPSASAVRRWRAGLCLNFHGGTHSAWLTACSGARWRAGFGHFRFQGIYNVRIPRAQQILGEERTVHTAEHLASAMFYLGAARTEIPRARLAAPRNGTPVPPRPYAVIHATAAAPEKSWPTANFAAVASHLQRSGLPPVVIGAASDDLSAFAPFQTVQGAPLGAIKTLLSSASLFVGNDSGPAHMAAAFGVPSVVIFGPSNREIWGPWHTRAEALSAPEGIAAIGVDRVLDALERLKASA
jgi:heptosyltransferase III